MGVEGVGWGGVGGSEVLGDMPGCREGCWEMGGEDACSKKTPTLTSVRCSGAACALKSSCATLVVRSGAEGRDTKRSKT